MDETTLRVRYLEFVIANMFADGVLQLPKHRHRLHESSRADRMPAGEQPTGGINRQLALERRMAFINEPSAFAVFAQAEILVGLEFARSVGVVQFDDVEVFERLTDSGHFVSRQRRHAPRSEGMDPRIAQ